jgi:peptidoglycan/LPS O-acetylase OafA/YrhL
MILLAAGLYSFSRLVFNYSCLALVYGAVTAFAMAKKPEGKFINWHGFYVLSRLSYGIYLNHFGLLSRVIPLLQPLRGKGYVALTLGYFLSLFACVGFAFLTFLFIEWPFLRVRERWLARAGHHKPAVPLHAGAAESMATQ